MTRAYQAVLLLVVGLALGSITVDGRYLNYLKPAMFWPLLLAAGVFVAVAVGELLALRRATADPDVPCGGGHAHRLPRAGWLLVLPVLTIGFVAPPALGSWAAERDPGTVAPPGSSDFVALPAGDPVAMSLAEYGVRAVWDDGRTLSGRVVELVGFVSPRAAGDWFLTRMTLSCCAADALATKVQVRGAVAPETDAWVRVRGRYEPSAGSDRATAVPALTALEVTAIDEPQNPYE